ncbi:flavin reductase family protein [Lentisphaerota bacterium WC36G]|nr:flavin reductase family protein [Lentisphaerae bacterium WC36]
MKNIGKVMGLYPTPVVIVGVYVGNRVNWINIAHIGIIGLDKIMLSIAKNHFSNQGIEQYKSCSLNIIDRTEIEKADYVGIVSGEKIDKSQVFAHQITEELHVPIISSAKVAMECSLFDNYKTDHHDNFVLEVINTFVDENVLNDDGKIDYLKVDPLMFEMPNRKYLSVGEELGKCWSIGLNKEE